MVRSAVSASAGPGAVRTFWFRARRALKATSRSEAKASALHHLLRPYVWPQRGRLALMVIVSTASGLADAATLVIIAQITFTIAKGDTSASADIGPISATITVTTMLVVAGSRGRQGVAEPVHDADLGADDETSDYGDAQGSCSVVPSRQLGSPVRAGPRGALQDVLTRFANATPARCASLGRCCRSP